MGSGLSGGPGVAGALKSAFNQSARLYYQDIGSLSDPPVAGLELGYPQHF